MTVKEAISLLSCGTSYEIKGSYSGKIYYSTLMDKEQHVEQYYDEKTKDAPFYAVRKRLKNYDNGIEKFYTVIGIWMKDYHLCKLREEKE